MRWWWKRREPTTARLIRAEGALIDVSPLREKLGAAWSQYGPPVHRIAERIISQEIAGDGTFVRRGDVYELTFIGLARWRARRECVRIAEKLDETLGGGAKNQPAPGESPSSALPEPVPLTSSIAPAPANTPASSSGPAPAKSPASASGSVQTRFPVSADGPGSATMRSAASSSVAAPAGNRALARALAQQNGPASAPPPAPSDGPASPTFPTPNQILAAINVPAPDIQPGRDSAAAGASAVAGAAEQTASGDAARSNRMSRAMERAAAQAAWKREHGSGAAIFPPPDLRVDFRPFWEIRSKHVTMYGAVPTSMWGGHEHSGYTSILPRRYGAADTIQLDRLLLTESIAALSASNRPEHRALAITSLHAMTLEDDAIATEFIDGCKAIPEALRPRILFEIVDVDRLVGSAESYGKILRLSKFGRGVLGRSSVKATHLSRFKAMRLLAVGFDLADDTRPEATLIPELETFAVIAARANIESYARGLDSVSLTVAAMAAGVGYIEGMTLPGKNYDAGLRVVPFRINDLYGLPALQ